MEISKNLKLARQAREEDNSEDAKMFYLKVREEEPENGEAKYFYAYYSLHEGTNKELPKRFENLCTVVLSAVKLIKDSYLSQKEQLEAIEEIVNSFVPEIWAENRYMNNKNRETRVGDSYVTIFDMSIVTACCRIGMKALKDLGDHIEKLYAKDSVDQVDSYNVSAEATRLAVAAWKEYVLLSQKWYAYAVKGDPETYTAKIKNFDPSYEMPKKSGCISLADKR